MLVSFVFSEMGNLFLIIGIYTKKLNSATGKRSLVLNYNDLIKEFNLYYM